MQRSLHLRGSSLHGNEPWPVWTSNTEQGRRMTALRSMLDRIAHRRRRRYLLPDALFAIFLGLALAAVLVFGPGGLAS